MEVCANGHGRAFEGRKVVLGKLQVASVLKPSLRHDLIKIAQIDSYFDRILYSSTEGSDLERDHT